MDDRIENIFEWIKASSFVSASNKKLDIYLIRNDAKGRLHSGQVVNLVDWLQGFCLDSDPSFDEPKNLGGYYLTNGYLLCSDFSGQSVIEKFRRITTRCDVEKADIDALRTNLSAFIQVSLDPEHAISPLDGILTYEDKRTGLVWDTGRLFVSRMSNSPEDLSPLLNEISYAGYNDWRAATKFDLSTVFSNEAPHVIRPLSIVAPGVCWASFSQFRHSQKDQEYISKRIGKWQRDCYYDEGNKSPSCGLMYVRGEVRISEHEWMSKIVHWLSVNEPYEDIHITNEWQNLESRLPRMKRLSIFCSNWSRDPPALPAELKNLEELDELRFSDSGYYENSAGVDFGLIFNMHSLKSLSLDRNNITSVPSDIRNLSLLQNISLAQNSIESLPGEISELSFLTEIDLSRNKFTELPKELFSCQRLKTVNLESNLIRYISQFYSSPTLESLNLKSNELLAIPKSINELNKIRFLDVSYNNLDTIPSQIGQLHALKSLKLNANPLQCLPDEIGNLANLEVLDISSTKVECLPPSIVNLKKLTNINLNLSNRAQGWPNLSLSHDQLDWLRELVDSKNCRIDSHLRDILGRN
ncbi:MAG: hypothetical protein VR73_16230 [Gammaproteobacteria bacterium BRH_c0]|nr:MAG: hypothetical protein VR73_16230 [Gammaproteobacteria bacterium BRH_c0]